MNIKKIISILIIILIFGAGGVAVYFYRDSISKNKPADDNQKTDISIEDKKITDNTKPFTIEITYPSVAGLDDFNKKGEDLVNNELFEFKKNSTANDVAVKEIDPESYAEFPREYYLSINYDKGLVNENTISVVFNISNFTGGAHGANYFSALNYDIKNKKEIKLAGLFSGQTDYLQKISTYCIDDLTKQMTTSGAIDMSNTLWLDEGAGPKEENFSVFLINQDGITFYFPQYQVAAYAAGDFKVTMPR